MPDAIPDAFFVATSNLEREPDEGNETKDAEESEEGIVKDLDTEEGKDADTVSELSAATKLSAVVKSSEVVKRSKVSGFIKATRTNFPSTLFPLSRMVVCHTLSFSLGVSTITPL